MDELDGVVGEVLGTLDELGLADDTLVVFTSDNGGMLNHTGQKAWKAGHCLNGKLLGFKFGAWEGGHRIPFIVASGTYFLADDRPGIRYRSGDLPGWDLSDAELVISPSLIRDWELLTLPLVGHWLLATGRYDQNRTSCLG